MYDSKSNNEVVNELYALPTSYAQQRLWFLHSLAPDSPVYNIPAAFRLSGPIDVTAVENSIREIVRRHETLRTTFSLVDGEPKQIIAPAAPTRVAIADLRSQDEPEKDIELRRRLTEETRRCFNLEKGPLFQASLLLINDEESVLIINMHHIISDGWSLRILFRELASCYEAYSRNQTAALPELTIQYGDFAVWQREWLRGEVLEQQISYWKRQLEAIPAFLNLPTDRPRPAVQSFRGKSQSFELSQELTENLKAVGRKQDVTLFMTLLAAFQALLYRYTGQEDIVVGSPIANRTRTEIEELIGFFVNTLVLRANFAGNPTFNELLVRVRETALGAYAHQDLPFEKLVEELNPERSLSHSPLFQVMFVLQNAPSTAPQFERLNVSPVRIGGESAKFDLTLSMRETAQGLRGSLQYSTDLFDDGTMARMIGHFQTLLDGVVADPDQRISHLPILTDAETGQLLIEWNDTKKDYPTDKCIHELFEAQVEKSPDAVAVVFDDKQLTYRELNARANWLAHYLRKRGVGPETLVAICMERSLEMVVGLLGILKAGGAYVPMDPAYPNDRIAYILKDTQASILLTEKRLLEDFGLKSIEISTDRVGCSDSGFSVLESHLTAICLDRDWKEISQESRENLQNQATPANLAYVIYTSGSTGLPKGVMIEHGNAVAFLSWAHSVFTQEELAGVIASTSICFDLSIFELFAPLTSGGRVILLENALALSDLDPVLEPTLINTVPSVMIELLRLRDLPASIRTVNLAGEPLKTSLVQEIYERTSAGRVYDLYGPSETTTYSTYSLRTGDGLQTIGCPIGNAQVYILDPHLNPVPFGVSGELYIGGPGVARGYLNRSELTAEKFIKHPFSDDPQARLYKTGDRARYLAEGNIEFLGRTDNQVKIRGYRIELGEIEAVLSQDPWIQDAVVIARGDISGDEQLVAYVVPKRHTGNSPVDPSWAELQEKKVSEWQTLFDQTFAEAEEPKDPTTNTAGVNSSYTNSPIPAAESRDWVEHAAKRILSLNPDRVLDIGCGLGRMLFRIAPECSRYWGADFSQAALEYVEQHLHLLGNKRAEIKLIQANADDLSEIPGRHFDTVVINGVTQYFPHIEHLVKVLEEALNAVEPGGVIFVGDVRSLPLLEPFQLSVELFRASDDVPAELLWQTVKRNVAQEEELVVDPVFFSAICRRLTKIDRADILLKRGWAENELTRFRYDVILYVKPQEQPRLATAWLDWSKENLTLSSVRELLKSGEPRTLGIARVPNARVLPEYRAAASLARGGRTETVRALRDAIETMRAEAFHPETFWALQNDLPYWVDITWSNTGGPECFDVFLQRRDLAVVRRPPASFRKEQVSLKSWHLYAHNPTEAKRNRLLGSFLRSHLKKKLPDYMIPSAFVVLDTLPLTPNGKINRKALPAPAPSRPELDETFSTPRTPTEELLAGIWTEVLKIDKVGIHDNFFDLGGHSLLATRVVSRIRAAFNVDPPLRSLFEAPTIAGLAEKIETACRNQQDLQAFPIMPVPPHGDLPLSFSQQRLWFLDRYEPGSSVYNVPGALRLRGSLDIAALEHSLQEIIRRHEALRTTFSMAEGEPVQVIAPSVNLSLAVVDLTDSPESERQEEARRLAREEALRPFDLVRGPLFRTTLVRLGEEDHVLLLTMHHIVSDGWSMGVLHRELSVLYRAFTNNEPSPLPDLPIQYADYAVWQREWLQGEVLEGQLSYWKKQLEGIPAVLNLPTDRPRPVAQSFRGERQSIELSKELTRELKAFSRKEGVTLFMTLLAAFQTLLYRYTGQEDIVVGTPIANRTRTEIEGLIGFFVNTLVLRSNFSGNPTFKELLAQVREMALGAYAHQDLPFEKLVEELQPQRSLSHSPLFQVMFVLQNAPSTARQFEGLSVSPVRLAAETAKFDLTLSMHETEEGLRGSLQYSTDLFDLATVTRMLGHFQTLLQGIVANPDRQISGLPILTEAERHQLLVEWNDTKRDYPTDKCIYELVEDQVERTPDAVAVVFEDRQMTYRQLNGMANQLGLLLLERGIGKGSYVPILMGRSIEVVISMLSVMKAGAAFVPLDIDWPTERLRQVIEDLNSKVILVSKTTPFEEEELGRSFLAVDEQAATRSVANLNINTDAREPIYAIYTSGSTGKPKAAVVSHQGITNRFLWMNEFFGVETAAAVLLTTPHIFDSAVWQLFWPLINGGKTVIPSPGMEIIADYLSILIERQEVTITRFVPSVFNTIVPQLVTDGAVRQKLRSLRTITVGGEEITPASTYSFMAHFPRVRLINLYGPTEASIGCVCYEVTGSEGGKIPIGKPISNAQALILDRNMNLVPVGVAGELYLSGICLGLGYLNDEEKTKAVFVDNRFVEINHDKLYKTGDLARYLPDGNIEFLGRTDHQVKVRGYRIELGEIESVLGQHPAVREARVLAREDNPGDKRLVAYVVPRQEAAPTINEFRSFLNQKKLPEYMVPSVFVFLDALPLTPNGKVDRKALPVPAHNRPELEERYVAPRTPVEELLVEIWAGVLKLDKVGVQDNFFDLGGHSLLATQLISRLRHALQVELPLRVLFEKPTVAGLAERIEETHHKEHDLQSRPMLPVSRAGDLPLSFAQQRLWFLDQYEPNSSLYNIPGALRLRGSLDVGALDQSINEIILRHESLRTTFSMVEGEPVQLIASSQKVPLHVVDLTEQPESQREKEARRLAREEARRSFDLAQGPLFRTRLIRLGEDDHVLLLTLHHIVSDGWSMGVLHRELSVLYRAFTNNESSPLPEDLPIQYADYAVWQRQWLQGEVLEGQLSYWKKQLEGIPAVLNLPTDRPRPVAQSFRGKRQSIELSKELTRELKALSRKEGVTLFMPLLAAFQTLLYRYTGQEDIVVGSPIANRNRTEIEGLIGFFVNTLVLRSNFSGNPTFKELLARVREMALGAYAHQDLPFEKLVEELQPQRSLSHSPLFQIFFNMFKRDDSKLDLYGLTTERFSHSDTRSKFDLTMYVRDQDDEIHFNFVYNADLFRESWVKCLSQQYCYLLVQIVSAPEQPIQSYSLVTPEARALLPDPSAVMAERPQQLVTTTFSSLAKQTPKHPAISQGQQTWTYQELAERAETLAKVLRASGLQRRDVVAIYGPRSFGLIASMIGTLLSGGVLLPIDHTLPNQRKQLMLKEAKAKKLLCVEDKPPDTAWLERDCAPDILIVDPSDGRVVDAGAGSNLQLIALPEVSPDDPAYIFFTSGTTGVPKGVLGCHKGLSHFLKWQRETFAIRPDDRCTQLTSLSFDASLRDVFLPLTSGATLCLPEISDNLAGDEIVRWLERQRISVIHAVPSLAQSWLASVPEQIFLPSLRRTFFVGEPLTDALVRQWRSALQNGAEIINLYGPTETTLVKCFYRVPTDCRHGVQPVGRPIPDTQALVLSKNNQLCGINEPGEIVLRTPFRSLGYINAPEENQKRFVKNPFSDDAQDLMYFTGDVGRFAPDGTLEILGRLDDQVKICGVRVEPTEVTAILSQHPLVESCIVVGKKKGDETYLVAYVVASKERQVTSTQLRSYLFEQLPAAMAPSVFVFLDSLPLTPNGKVDRKALPEPDDSSEPEENFVAPRTAVEEMVAAIWVAVLKREKIGINDNFFDLGGHSLLATQVVSRISKTLRVELPLRALFENPTVASLSDLIETIRWTGKETQLTSKGNLDETEEITL